MIDPSPSQARIPTVIGPACITLALGPRSGGDQRRKGPRSVEFGLSDRYLEQVDPNIAKRIDKLSVPRSSKLFVGKDQLGYHSQDGSVSLGVARETLGKSARSLGLEPDPRPLGLRSEEPARERAVDDKGDGVEVSGLERLQ